MTDYFGHTRVPDPGEMTTAWAEPWHIDMAGAEMFAPVNKIIVGRVLGEAVMPGVATLEIGAGPGHLGSLIPPQMRSNYLQTDQSSQYVALSRGYNGLPAAVADIEHLDELVAARGRKFGAIVAMDVLDIVPNQSQAAEQIAGALEDNGVFVHFHNRRPSMANLSRPLRPLALIFPDIESDGTLKRFQLVRFKEYMAAHDSLDNSGAADIIAARPDLLDWLCEHERQTFMGVARDIAEHLGARRVRTGTFVELMHKAARTALEGAGMSIVQSATYRSERQTTRKRVAAFLAANGKGPEVNVVSKRAGGIYFDHAELPKNQVLLANDLSVLVAQKQ